MGNKKIVVLATKIDIDYRLQCVEKCSAATRCELLQLKNKLKSAEEGLATLSLVIANDTGKARFMPAGCWELVDARGFSCGGLPVCEALLPPGHVNLDSWVIAAGTRVRTMLAFPLNGTPFALLYDDGKRKCRLLLTSIGEKPDDSTGKIRREAVKTADKLQFLTCWSVKDTDGRRKYICIGTKK